LQELFEAQAAWQRARAKLSWPEKVRMAEVMRETARQLRRRSPAKAGEREATPGRRPSRGGIAIQSDSCPGFKFTDKALPLLILLTPAGRKEVGSLVGRQRLALVSAGYATAGCTPTRGSTSRSICRSFWYRARRNS